MTKFVKSYLMRVTAHFYLVNEDFSPEYAEANHGGEETENNMRYYWEDSLKVKNEIKSIELLEDSVYTIQGVFPDGNGFSFDIPNMTQLLLHGEDESVTALAFSKHIYHNYTQEKDGEHEIIRVYFKDYEVFSNPIPGVYITAKDFPKELAR